jgi:hypothetical protein
LLPCGNTIKRIKNEDGTDKGNDIITEEPAVLPLLGVGSSLRRVKSKAPALQR